MRARSAFVATAALLAGAVPFVLLPSGASAGGPAFSITVADPNVKLKESFTVTGTAPCANAPYTATFSYTDHDGNAATLEVSGTAGADGAISQAITVPEAATPDQPADVDVTATCDNSEVTSNTVDITVEVSTGVLTTDKAEGRAGTVVNVSGTNCLGDEVVVVFGDDSGATRVTVTLRPDDTFSGSYTIPNVPPGNYFFAAACPGTDYEDRAFRVVVTPGGPRPSPLPSEPTRGPVNYTG